MKCWGRLLVSGSLGLAGCAAHNNSPQVANLDMVGIVSGTDVSAPDLYSQHVVFLQVKMANGTGMCTGSILDSETILTAAHCLTGGKQARIVFANNVRNQTIDETQIRNVDKAAIFPKYQAEAEDSANSSHPQPGPDEVPSVQEVQDALDSKGDFDYDVAVLHFTGGLPAGYTPVQLASSPSIVSNGSALQMIGYGLSEVNALNQKVNDKTVIIPRPNQATVGQLRETSIAVASYDTKIGMIFTSGTQSSVCSGDSGGPGFMIDPQTGQPVQVGIAEAVANSYCNSVSMHTAVFPYLTWIKQIQAKMSESPALVASAKGSP